MILKDLLRAAPPVRLAGGERAEVRGLTHDSRLVRPGWVFFALPGSKTDGNRFAKKACEAGACAVISELEPPPAPVSLPAAWVQVSDAAAAMGRMADLYFGHPSRALTVAGVTGTNGKTTTTYFLESIAAACGKVCGVAGTVDYRLGGLTLEKAPNTTPISLELLRLLARFRDGGASLAALEVSSHALALKRVEEVEFDAAVFTNLGRDHLDFHKTVEDYFSAKARLFELLGRTSSTKKRRLAVLNADDPRCEALRRLCGGAEVLRYGLGAGAELRAENLRPGLSGSSFDLVFRGRRLPAAVALAGRHNVSNALAAAATALGLGLPEEGVLRGLRDLARVPGRLESVEEGQDFRVFVDYAHTPDALSSVLAHLKGLAPRRILTVFGCGGERDRGKRGPMGEAACRGSDLVFVTSDNPRGEDPLAILGEIEAALKSSGLKNYKIIAEREKAIAEAVASAENGDAVLIAGKGHEDVMILKDRVVPFDDRAAARAALRARPR